MQKIQGSYTFYSKLGGGDAFLQKNKKHIKKMFRIVKFALLSLPNYKGYCHLKEKNLLNKMVFLLRFAPASPVYLL
jgi:hypothetical protein